MTLLPPDAPAARRLAWLRPLFWSVLVWQSVSLLMGAIIAADQLRRGVLLEPWRPVLESTVAVLVLTLYSWLLYLAVERWPQRWSRPRNLGLLYLACASVVVPLCVVGKVIGHMHALDRPWSTLGANVLKQDGYLWWWEVMVSFGTFAAVVGLSAWQRSHRRERDWALAQGDNLRLRLALLQGQLEPHFLFNTLNGVSSLVRAGDRSQALSALSRVSELLRYALRVSRLDWVSVQDELDFVSDYLALQTLRFGADLQLEWDLAEADWSRAACPPLLLQPLVENAIRHGLEASGGAGRVRIALRRAGQTWWLRIANACPEQAAPSAGHGLGLGATRERLAMLYGAAADLRTWFEERSFVLELSLPWRDSAETANQ